MVEIEQQQLIMQLVSLQEEAKRIEATIQDIDARAQEFQDLKQSVEKLEDEQGKDILAPVGRGIFFKSELKEKKLYVNVGSDIVVKKNPKQAAEIVGNQIKELENLRDNLFSEMQKINLQMQGLVEKAEKSKSK